MQGSVACVILGWQSIVEAETNERGDNNIASKLVTEGGNVLIAGAGWMGYLWLAYLSKHLPNAKFHVTEPNLDRWQTFKRSARMWGCRPQLLSQSVDDDPIRGKMDLAIYANASRGSVRDLLKWVRPNGHISLFSGINGGQDEPVFDGPGFVNLERVHRKGGWKWVHLTNNPTGAKALASGSSGYSMETFRRAVLDVGMYYYQMACGVSGVVLGFASDHVMVQSNRAATDIPISIPYSSRRGSNWPVLVDIFEQLDWHGRASHLKIICHPWDTVAEFSSAYRNWIGPNIDAEGN